ncbi:MAG: hypothetical protein CK538_07980 [Opitutia bacterium]|nr:MAG: hypothetical protein CK538_07980 [Opitutae bacterium]
MNHFDPAAAAKEIIATQPIEESGCPEQFLQVLEMINAPKKIRCSSGYPHWDFDHPLIVYPPLPHETKQRIFHAHATALYRLGTPTAA